MDVNDAFRSCVYDVLDICSFIPSSTCSIYNYIPHRTLLPSSSPSYPSPIRVLCFYAYNLGRGRILPAEHPHEDKLHDVAVKEEELRSPVSLRAVDRLHAAC